MVSGLARRKDQAQPFAAKSGSESGRAGACSRGPGAREKDHSNRVNGDRQAESDDNLDFIRLNIIRKYYM